MGNISHERTLYYLPLNHFIKAFAICFVTCPSALNPVRFYIIVFICLAAWPVAAQYKIQGTVLDSSRTYPLEAVSVLSTNGRGTLTNKDGFYTLDASDKDSIWFSYLGKPTQKFPVAKMTNLSQFDVALQVSIPVLAEIKLRPRNYRQDSLQNRRDYQKVFDFRRPNVESMTSIGPAGAGIDINELIRLFQFKKNASMMRFQERLLQQEQEKYIDYRFSPALVRRLTGLEGEALKTFMQAYRPPYEFVLYSREYDFQLYIKEAYKRYKNEKAF